MYDDLSDGDIAYTIVTAAAASSDPGYNGLNPPDVSVTNINEVAGFTVAPTSGLVTTEAGGAATFTVRLTIPPTANVVLGLSSGDASEGTVSPSSLTFTSLNWNIAQTVTVTGVNDLVDDGDVVYAAVTAAAASADTRFNGVNPADVWVTNTDDDLAGVTLVQSGAATLVAEGGATDTYTLVLNSQPTADVVITPVPDSQLSVSPGSLTFTATNWNVPQTVTVTAVDDAVVEKVHSGQLTHAAVSGDASYQGIAVSELTAQITDNDTAGITVSPTGGLVTTEAGGQVTFTIRLTSQPTASVTIGLSSSDLTEGTVSPASVTFTAGNWSTPQTVTVTGVDDPAADGNVTYAIVTAESSSTDGQYYKRNAEDVYIVNADNEVLQLTLTVLPASVPENAGASAAVGTVSRNGEDLSQPWTVTLSSSDPGEATVPATVTIPANQSSATFPINAVDDALFDGTQTVNITASALVSAPLGLDTAFGIGGFVSVPLRNPPPLEHMQLAVQSDRKIVAIGRHVTDDQAWTLVRTNADSTLDTSFGSGGVVTTRFPSESHVSPSGITVLSNGRIAVVGSGDVIGSLLAVYNSDGSLDTGFGGSGTLATSLVWGHNVLAGTDGSFLVSGSYVSGRDVAVARYLPNGSLDASFGLGGIATVSVVATDGGRALARQPDGKIVVTGYAGGDLAVVRFQANGTLDPTFSGDGKLAIDLGAYEQGEAIALQSDGKIVVAGTREQDTWLIVRLNSDGTLDSTFSGDGIDLPQFSEGGNEAHAVVLQTDGKIVVGGGVWATGLSSAFVRYNADGSLDPTFDGDGKLILPPRPGIFEENWSMAFQSDGQLVALTGYANNAELVRLNLGTVTLTASAPVQVTDHETLTIAILPDAISEGGSATATVTRSNTDRTAPLTVTLTSSDLSEATVPASVTILAGQAAATFQVAAVDDVIIDGAQTVTITGTAAGYVGAADSLVINDNDLAGFAVTPASGLTTTEAGGQAAFTVRLTSQPTASVTIGISSSDLTEGTVSPASLTFTAGSWNSPQTVTVTGVDDPVDDGDVGYTIVTATAVSGDGNYSGINPADVTVQNLDDDTAGIAVSAISGDTTEAGGAATFTVVLETQPAADVTIGLSSGDLTEGTVAPASLTFTTANWNTPRSVTVTGVDDLVDDGDVVFTVVTAAAVSTDAKYNGLNSPDVSVTNRDNDGAGITVAAISGDATEAGGTATFTIVLDSQPTAGVAIGLSSSDATEGTVSPTSVSFTPANWNVAQTVTVTGVDDLVDDGDITFTIVTASAASGDANYNGRNAADVAVKNLDDDTAGITVSAISGNTTESGGTATFTVVLNTQPTTDVTIGLSSSDLSEGTVLPTSVTLTPANWNTPQSVTVTGVDDPVDDEDITFTIVTAAAVSSDAKYSGLNAADVTVKNLDNDAAGITVSAVGGAATEAGGTATFTIVLATQPTADVTIGLASGDLTEGTVAPASLTFTAANWSTPQTVTVTGVDDPVDDGDITFTIITAPAVSSDGNYSGINAADVAVKNLDDDTAGIMVSAIDGDTTEAGGTAMFTILLATQPTADVTIGLSSNDLTEGTVAPASLTFTAANWNTPQAVTVTGVDDLVDDGDVVFTVVTAAAVSADAKYNGLGSPDVSVTNRDNDGAGIAISAISGNTIESGGTATFTIQLDSQPTAAVTIGFSTSDSTEGTVSPTSVSFTPANWNTPQIVAVTGVDDWLDDGDVTFSIITAPAVSGDGTYSGLNAADVTVKNLDDDTAGITVSAIDGDVTESGGTATFTIVLDTQPTADVTIGLSSSELTEGTVLPTSVTFTPANWNTPQPVTVTGVDDDRDDGDVAFTIVTTPAISADGTYSGRNAADVTVKNLDNDTAGITVSAIDGDTTEAGGMATFTVVLDNQPVADVFIGLSSSDSSEGTVSPASLTFTAANWFMPQTVTVTGVDDLVDDGDVGYTIVTASAVSNDGNYSGINAADVTIKNLDDDTAGITVSAIDGDTTEAGDTAAFTIVLETQPTANVTIGLSSGDLTEGTVAPASLTFTAANWNSPQSVTVTGVDDLVDDGNVVYSS